MGKTQTIADKERQDAEFKAFMEKLASDSRKKETEMLEAIQAVVSDFYTKNGWKFSRFFGDRRSDYQNYSDWSLQRVADIITTIGKAISAAKFPSPEVPGSEKASPETNAEVKQNLPAFVEDINLTINRVVALLNGFLTQFASHSSVSQKAAFQDLPMSGGLHLFIAQSGSVYHEKKFFETQFIGSFQIVFEAYMSVEEARAISIQQILKTTQKEIEIVNAQILDIREVQGETLKQYIREPKMYKETKLDFDEMIAMMKVSRDELVKEYDKYKTVSEMVDDLLPVIDLAPLGISFATAPGHEAKVPLSEIFEDAWEARLAERMIREKIGA
ncbi:hypothetical protein [Aquabacter spiritensis]|uniref:Uncharacterized protein n=1 Tax=Aquabacter spiritensis TaxID=933073 RepID=A0A4R3LY19_9HYPH|nr:hypothetical protein [Aquabacter spiritensis]TCT05542.1 hypothetical protein EDC64_10499 [Aquabacter spiritensis]